MAKSEAGTYSGKLDSLDQGATIPIDRTQAYDSHVTVPSMAAKEEFGVHYIRRMIAGRRYDVSTRGPRAFGGRWTSSPGSHRFTSLPSNSSTQRS